MSSVNSLIAWFLLKETKGLNKEELMTLYNKEKGKNNLFNFQEVKSIIEGKEESTSESSKKHPKILVHDSMDVPVVQTIFRNSIGVCK